MAPLRLERSGREEGFGRGRNGKKRRTKKKLGKRQKEETELKRADPKGSACYLLTIGEAEADPTGSGRKNVTE